jgi:hypothetical protein
MRSPLWSRFPDRSGCHGRDLTTRARLIQLHHVCRCHDPGQWQAIPACSGKRRTTRKDIRLSEQPDTARWRQSKRPGSPARHWLVGYRGHFFADGGPWDKRCTFGIPPKRVSSPGFPVARAAYASTGSDLRALKCSRRDFYFSACPLVRRSSPKRFALAASVSASIW